MILSNGRWTNSNSSAGISSPGSGLLRWCEEVQNLYEGGDASVDVIDRRVKDACSFLQQYPIEVGYDTHWKTFSWEVQRLFEFLDDGHPEKTAYHLPEIESALTPMMYRVKAESFFDPQYPDRSV